MSERLALAQRAVSAGFWDWDLRSGRIVWSDEMWSLFGCVRPPEGQEADLWGVWREVLHPDDRARAEAEAQAAAREVRPLAQEDYRVVLPDGSVRWIESRGMVWPGADGKPANMAGICLDVSERKRAELALQESKARMESLAAAVSGVFYEYRLAEDGRSRYTYVGPGCEAIFEIVPEAVLADSDAFWRLIHPEDLEAFLETNRRASRERNPFQAECRVVTPSGRTKWIHIYERPLAGAAGTGAWCGFAQDVTHRKLAEQRLESQERELRRILDNLPVAVTVTELSEGVPLRFVNRSFTSTFGYALEEVPDADTLAARLCPDAAYRSLVLGRLRETLAAARAGEPKGQPQPLECRLLTREGSERDVVLTAMQLDGVVLTTFADVTERKRREEANRRILDNIPVPMLVDEVAGERRITFLNRSFVRTFGYSLEDIPTVAHWAGLAYPDPQYRREVYARWNKALAGAVRDRGTVEGMEVRVVCKDGTARDVLISALAMDDILLVVLLDISERKQTESVLREAKLRAERLESAKSQFLANMSHEIRTPLNVVLGTAELLHREPLKGRQHAMLSRIQEAGESLMGVINDILDFSRIEARQMPIESRPVDLPALLTKVRSLLGPTARERGITFEVEAPPEYPGAFLGDPLRLEQVLTNLVSNALKFTERGQVSVRTQLRGEGPSPRLRFEVRDTGIGIPPEAIPALFSPFSQADSGITRRFGGSGLGLSISSRLVEMMDGLIGVESEPGRGSLFWFEVPSARCASQVIERAEQEPAPAQGALRGMRVLVADDSAMNRDLMVQLLALEGAGATLANDGAEAVELLRERAGEFDAVLMDVQMPAVDGLTATRIIRNELGLKDLPVIASTAGVLQAEQQAAREAGVNDVLPKPFAISQLVRCLSRYARPRRGAPGERSEQASAASRRALAVEGLPEIAGIDREHAVRTMDGNRGLFLKLLDLFLTESAGVVALTRADLASGELKAAARRVHTLRGGARQLGALGLASAAEALEQAIERGSGDLENALLKLEREFGVLEAASAPWRGA